MQGKFGRRGHALKSIAQKRASIVNLNALVRVYLLDGSSKVLQMLENSSVRDVLSALKFNLDLHDISTFALFRVAGFSVRRLELSELIVDALRDLTESGQEIRLLFRSWISYKYGGFDSEVFQYGVRHKQPTTALWLSFMEATFMTMTGQYHLCEDEALMLGCLKLQAESGDFDPARHSLEMIKNRVSSRFPEPVKSKMQALRSPTIGGSRSADDLAARVLDMYAHIAGKTRAEAQLDSLESLRSWCPYYGSTFYEVQCQYDDNPLDAQTSPPVLAMQAAVGPRALFLMTNTHPPVVMRHAYKRIVKWVTHADKHIFMYWVIKPSLSLADLEEYQEEQRESGGTLDTRRFCDCVYLVTVQVRELELLVKSYIDALADIAPQLPGASGELLPPQDDKAIEELSSNHPHPHPNHTEPLADANSEEQEESHSSSKKSGRRLSVFFNILGGADAANAPSGSGLSTRRDEHEDEVFCDDTAAVSNSLFKSMYNQAPGQRKSANNRKDRKSLVLESDAERDEDACFSRIPATVTYAASMSELQRLAQEADFSDEEEGDSGDDDDDDDDSGAATSASPNQMPTKGSEQVPLSAFRRASRILFGGAIAGGSWNDRTNRKNNSGESDSESNDSSDSGDGNNHSDDDD